MDIDQIVALAKRIHDAEHVNLGSSSTREQRNAFWARVVGCVHHGHQVYNASPDPHWYLKKAGPNSPQSDDVVVFKPNLNFWDCIPGAGTDSYRFQKQGPELLDVPPQVLIAPPVPDGSGTQPPQPQGNTVPYTPYAGDDKWKPVGQQIAADYARKPQGLDADVVVWAARTIHDATMGPAPGTILTMEESIAKHRAEWCAALGVPVTP